MTDIDILLDSEGFHYSLEGAGSLGQTHVRRMSDSLLFECEPIEFIQVVFARSLASLVKSDSFFSEDSVAKQKLSTFLQHQVQACFILPGLTEHQLVFAHNTWFSLLEPRVVLNTTEAILFYKKQLNWFQRMPHRRLQFQMFLDGLFTQDHPSAPRSNKKRAHQRGPFLPP